MWSWYPCRITTGCRVWKFFTHITLTLVGMRAQGARLIDAFCLLSTVVSFNHLLPPCVVSSRPLTRRCALLPFAAKRRLRGVSPI